MVDLVNSLQSPDLSPLFGLVNQKRQDELIAYERERQNKLDALAMAEFNERVKQNRLANERADFNAETNRINANANAASRKMAEEQHALEMKGLQQSLSRDQIVLDQARVNQILPQLGPDLEVAIASVDADQPVPQEIKQKLFETISAAEEMLSEGTFGTTFSSLKRKLEVAIDSSDPDSWKSIESDISNILRFSQAGEDEVLSEYDRVRIENVRSQIADRERRAENDTRQFEADERNRINNGNKILSTINDLLSDKDGLENNVGGLFNKANPGKLMPGSKDWLAKFNFIKANMTLDGVQKLKGPTSDRDLVFIGDSTGLNLDRSEKGFIAHLEGMRAEMEALGYKDERGFDFQEQDADGIPDGTIARDANGNLIVVKNGKWVKK